MRRSGLVLIGTLVCALGAGITGCSDDPVAPTGSITLQFSHGAGLLDLSYNDFLYTTALGDQYSVETIKYYVSNFELHRPVVPKGRFVPLHGDEGDGDVAFDLVHYIDPSDPTTLTLALDGIPADEYSELTFIFGVDELVNVPNGLPATQENINMIWPDPQGGGYHYMKMEGKYIDGSSGDTLNYRTHLGKNNLIHHYFTVSLPLTGVTSPEDYEIDIRMDMNEWYTNPNDYDFPADPMIMGNITIQNQLSQNGQTAFSITGITPAP